MRYGILGPLEVRDGARAVRLAQGRQRLLLAVLLVHANEALSSDRLIDALWGETPPPTAARSLHNLVSGLRKALGDGALVTEGRSYRLRVAENELDAQRFQALVQRGRAELAAGDAERAAALLGEARELWRGPPLADLAYEAALQAEAARLDEERLAALEEHVEAELALGRHAELVGELEALVAQHPLRERLRGQQMLALYRCGRQADALRAYGDARRRMVEELGIEPGAALRRLERAVLDQDPALGKPDRLPPRHRTPGPTSRLSRALAAARRRPALLVGAGVLLLGAALGMLLLLGGSDSPKAGLGVVAGNSLAAIDPETNRIVAEFPVGGAPTGVAVGAGAVWTVNADQETIARVDLGSKTVKTFATGTVPLGLAVGPDALWVVEGKRPTSEISPAGWGTVASAVARIDPLSGTRQATTTLRLPPFTATVPVGDLIAAGRDAVWAIGLSGWVHRRDLRSGRLLTRRSLDAIAIAAGDEQVWIRDGGGHVVRLDPRTGRVIARVSVPSKELSGLAVGAGAVWLTDPAAGTVWRVDLDSLEPRAIGVEPGVDSVAVGRGDAWVANSARGTVARIDAASNRVAATVTVGNAPRGVAVGGGRVWVSVAGPPKGETATRGALRTGARVKPLPAPPCGPVRTGGDGDPDVLIASDLPLRNPQINTTLPMSEAVAFVLRQRRFRAGRFRLGYQSCDHAMAQTGVAEATICRANARAYARNVAVVGVVGPLNSYCAGAMLPILNQAPRGPVALVSPTNSDPGLVRPDPGAPGLLRQLYPAGQRGYARVYPSDEYDTAAGALLARRLGGGEVFYLEDRETAQEGPGRTRFRRAASRIGLRIADEATWRIGAKSYRALAARIRDSGVRAVYINASYIGANLGRLLRDLRAVLGPRVAIIGNVSFTPVSALLADAGRAGRGTYITSPGLPVDRLGASGRRFVREFGATQPGERVTNLALYAAAATEVLLDAIARSDGTRESVTRALARTRLEDSVIGPIALDRNGELVANPVSIMRAERGGSPEYVLGVEGSVVEDIITPPASLVDSAGR